ncbi:LmeA family phospholipid-binding protein [Streptomyces erythrochromogenes]|uniref:LmeA family phospholipid-binding protein n=1 Tax=Streptomyces erythrochromogenes TaxID=285574 RepID=UPI0037F8F202
MRILRVVVIIGVVLGALFVGADRWAVGYAENQLADRIQARQGLAGSTEVEIHGFPFLTQALSHDLDRVDLKLKGVEVVAEGRKTRLSELDASFRGVRLNGDYSGGTAERAEGAALITYADLTAASQTGATLSYGGAPGKVKVTASVDIAGRKLSRSVISTITLVDAPDAKGGKGGKIVRVHAEEVPGEGIPGLERLVRRQTDFDRNIEGGLPAGLQLSALTSDEAGVHLTLGGSNVAMAGS